MASNIKGPGIYLAQFGAVEVPRTTYLRMLERALTVDAVFA